MSATWTTNDGKVLDVKWMDSQHLINSINLIVRKNKLDRKKVDELVANTTPPNKGFAAMVNEAKARHLWLWAWDSNKAIDQLQRPRHREDHNTMCLLRAMLDTGVTWPQVVNGQMAIGFLQQSPEVTFMGIDQALADPAEKDNAALHTLVAKYTEYRLMPKVNP